MGHRSSVLAISAVLLLGLGVGARAELIDPPPPQDTIQDTVKDSAKDSVKAVHAVPTPRARPVAFHHPLARPVIAALSPQPAICIACTRYVLMVGIGF